MRRREGKRVRRSDKRKEQEKRGAVGGGVGG